jgi:hypothetical protein
LACLKFRKGEKVDMKKVLLVVLILFSILALSNYASAQIYAKHYYGVDDWEPVPVGIGTLVNLTFNLTSARYCLIEATGWFYLHGNAYMIWLEIDSEDDVWDTYAKFTQRYIAGDLLAMTPFHTSITRNLVKGSHTIRLRGGWEGFDELVDIGGPRSITVICDTQGKVIYDPAP